MTLNPQIFIAAAESVHDDLVSDSTLSSGMCWAVDYCLRRDAIKRNEFVPSNVNQEYAKFMAKSFRPRGRGKGDYWFGTPRKVENQESRIFALLFLAEMAKDQE